MAKHVTAYASAARTATPTAVTVPTGRYTKAVIVADVTAVTATPSVVMTVDGKDNTSGKWYNIITSTAMTDSGAPYTRTLRVGPGLTASANLTVLDILPDVIRVTMTHGDADSITYSVGVNLY